MWSIHIIKKVDFSSPCFNQEIVWECRAEGSKGEIRELSMNKEKNWKYDKNGIECSAKAGGLGMNMEVHSAHPGEGIRMNIEEYTAHPEESEIIHFFRWYWADLNNLINIK